jgi:glycosyltransferase involved in cell wall biosynthesis
MEFHFTGLALTQKMKHLTNKLLIVSYTFPPSPGIGGRRWAKFAKYLHKEGYEVHVLCHKRKNKSPLSSDSAELSGINIHEFGGFYPESLLQTPTDLWQKVKYQFWMRILPLFYKGTIYDKSILSENSFKRKFQQIITRHDINNVFITTAPFNLGFYGAQLKKKHNFFLTIDFRDPWTWGEGYGYQMISKKRKNYDLQRERFVVENSDAITAPSEEIIKHLSSSYPNHHEKFLEVPHAIDTEKFSYNFQEYQKLPRPNGDKFFYAGTLYEGFDIFLRQLIDTLQKSQNTHPEFYRHFKFDLFCMSDYQTHEKLVKANGLDDKIQFHEPLEEQELFKEIAKYSAALIFFPDKFRDFISTKFPEIIYTNTPIIYVGAEGKVSDFLTKSEVGIRLSLNKLDQIVDVLSEQSFSGFENFPISSFEFEIVTKQMIAALEKLDLKGEFWKRPKT